MEKLRFLVETYVDYQKDRVRFENRLRSLPADFMEETFFQALAKDVKELEKAVAMEIHRTLKEEPLYTEYLQHQKGIGTMMAAYLMAWLDKPREFTMFGITEKLSAGSYKRKWKGTVETLELPPYANVIEENLKDRLKFIRVRMPPVMEVAQNPSDLHKYCGLSPGSKLRKKEMAGFNPKLKTLMWKILRQLMMAQGEWAKIFAQDKKEYAERCPDPEKGSKKLKIHLTAKNITMRKFMTNLWLVFRWQNKLPTTTPFVSKLGPQHTILQPFIETEEGIQQVSQLKT